MPDLDQQLTDLGATLAWPPTPSLSRGVRQRITAGSTTPRWRPGTGIWYRSQWAIAAAAVIVVAAALFAYPPSRAAIASWVNLHVLIKQSEYLPTPSPLPSGPIGKRLGLGDPTTLPIARTKVTWTVLIPASLGSPDEVYLQPPPGGPARGEVTLVYAAQQGTPVSGQTGVSVLITEARGAVNANFFGKMIGPGTTLEDVTVAGHQGYWIAGKPHIFFFIDASGAFRDETMRLATNTLILDYGGTVVRIEGDLTKAQALQIAESLA
jgi:hypothetical protein